MKTQAKLRAASGATAVVMMPDRFDVHTTQLLARILIVCLISFTPCNRLHNTQNWRTDELQR